MRPEYIHAYETYLRRQNIPFRMTWYDLGHDILYPAHRHGRIYADLGTVRRDPRPREVRVVTGDYRAARQHWVTVTRIPSYPELARVVARADGATITLETSNASEIAIDLRTVPLDGEQAIVVADGHEVYRGPRASLGHVARIARDTTDGPWRLGVVRDEGPRAKRPGSSGPISDAYYDRMIHVYGTARVENLEPLRRAAQQGAHGWPVYLWNLEQEVVPDTAVTEEMMRSAHLVLYGTPGDNTVLDRIAPQLPFAVDATSVTAGERRFTARQVGVRYK